jgi:hypothetical protein
MSIQTTPQIGSDGKVMTETQIQLRTLQTAFKEADAAHKKELAALEKRIVDLETKLEQAEREKRRGPKF